MNNGLAQEAVAAALSGNWERAAEVNEKIVKDDRSDVEALNRLAKAYIELKKINKARATAKKVLKLDPFNPIATKSLGKWKGLKKGELSEGDSAASSNLFLEEPGKTKILPLLYPGDEKVIARLDTGDEVLLKPSKHRVSITTRDGKYVGRLTDDVSARLRKLVKIGNQYKLLVKSVEPPDKVRVFVRETKRADSLKHIPTFSTEKVDYISFTPPELVHKKEDLEMTPNEDAS